MEIGKGGRLVRLNRKLTREVTLCGSPAEKEEEEIGSGFSG